MSNETITFRENEACEGCEHLQQCREDRKPRRTSCWIRHCRQKYWEPKLGEKHERQ